jgi:hypothetical protein
MLGLIECGDDDASAVYWLADAPTLESTLRGAQAYAARLGLTGDGTRSALFSAEAPFVVREFAASIGLVMRRPASNPQFDLFFDSVALRAEAAVRTALIEHRLDDARKGLSRLSDGKLMQDLSRLIEAVATAPSDPSSRRVWLEGAITPLARFRLGADARTYLGGLWSTLAEDLSAQAFDPDRPLEHASYAWLRASAWARACDAIEREPEWQLQPALNIRIALAYAGGGRLAAARMAWMQLCWFFPDAAEGVFERGEAGPVLDAHWQRFRLAEIDYPVADFPAWMLLADARHLDWLAPDSAPNTTPGRAYRALHELIRGGGDIEARRRLNTLNARLLKLYLASLKTPMDRAGRRP